MVSLHVYVQKLLYYHALTNVWGMRSMGEEEKKSRRKPFLVPEFKEAKQVKTTVSDESYRQLEAEAKRKEITMSEVVRQIIYNQQEKKQQSQSETQWNANDVSIAPCAL
jgi:macrodomain Ter protein organizer (MatP/YcbG family)